MVRNKIEAKEECGKYGDAFISKPPSHNMINVTKMDLEIVYGKHYDQCEYFWTPFTDKYNKGEFIDEVSNETIRYKASSICVLSLFRE